MTNVSGHCKLRIRQSNRPTGAILHNVCHVTVHICHQGNKPNYQQSRRWIAKKPSLALSNCMNCWRAESPNLRATVCNKDMAFLTYQWQCTVSTEVGPSTTMTTGHVNLKKSEGPIFRPVAETWPHLRVSGKVLTKQQDGLPWVLPFALRSREVRFGCRLFQSFWNLTVCRDACQIPKRYDHYNIQSRNFETSRDLALKRLSA